MKILPGVSLVVFSLSIYWMLLSRLILECVWVLSHREYVFIVNMSLFIFYHVK